jgi:glutathione-independent formaldehyde dehydrogenase
VKAVVYKEPFKVAVEEVEDPKLQHPNDVIVKITSTAICGSDLHMYEGRTAAEPGIVFGHENMGIIDQAGDAVTSLQTGDRVVMPFNVACGFCKNCAAGYTGFCLTVNPGFAGGAYGYVAMGPYPGGQAEYLRVPYADFNCLKLPPGTEHETDFILLADIFPTGYHGCELAGVSPGVSVAVYGAGPVGLMAAYSALLRGASKVFVVDRVPERLQKAEEIGSIPIDFTACSAAEQIKDQTAGEGTDTGVDAVGYQARAGGEEREEPAGRAELARRHGAGHRGARRAGSLRPVRSGRSRRAGEAGHAPGLRREAVREGPAHGHGTVQREEVQQAAA